MYTEVRIALVLLATVFAALAAWYARTAIVDILVMRRSWTRTEGLVTAMPARQVEIEIGTEADTRRILVSTDTQLGLSLFKKTAIFVDPANPERARSAGLLQLWLRPVVLALMAMFLCVCAVTAARVGRGPVIAGDAAGRWMLTPPPPPLQTELRVHRPASEWKAPLFWSLLGFGMAACGLFARSGAFMPRLGAASLGVFFVLLTGALSLHNGTIEVAADAHGIRESSAFGWRDFRWEDVGGIETREVVSVNRRAFSLSHGLPFPGNTTRSLVFTGHGGRTLMRLSIAMQPGSAMRRLLDLCALRTGQQEQFRRIYVPDI
jgi:hypothetical protein